MIRKSRIFFVALAALAYVGCESVGDNDTETPQYPNAGLEVSEITIVQTEVVTVGIDESSDCYTAFADDVTLVTPEVLDKNTLQLTGCQSFIGSTLVTLKEDNDGSLVSMRAKIVVNVVALVDLELEDEQLRIDIGAQKSSKITTGNGTYSVVSDDPDKVTGEVIDGELVVSAIDYCTNIKVTVSDKMGKEDYLYVTVTDPLEAMVLDDANVPSTEIYVGDTFSIPITSGNGGYSITLSNNDVISATYDAQNDEYDIEVTADGWVSLYVTDQYYEKSETIEFFVEIDTTNTSPRFSFNGYRGDIASGGADDGQYATVKYFFWYTDSVKLAEGEYYVLRMKSSFALNATLTNSAIAPTLYYFAEGATSVTTTYSAYYNASSTWEGTMVVMQTGSGGNGVSNIGIKFTIDDDGTLRKGFIVVNPYTSSGGGTTPTIPSGI